MAKITQARRLYEAVKAAPDGVAINELRQKLMIMNPMEAKRQANLKEVQPGEHIETYLIRRTSTGAPINGYRMMAAVEPQPFKSPKPVNSYRIPQINLLPPQQSLF